MPNQLNHIYRPFSSPKNTHRTGLDSAQAQNVMQALHTLAADGRIVVFSIHQPRSSIFAMFSQLLLVAEGRLVYSGPAAATAAHFAAAGHPCPQGFNPADWLLDVTSLDYRSAESEAASLQRVRELADLWAAHGDADVEVRLGGGAGGGGREVGKSWRRRQGGGAGGVGVLKTTHF